MNGGKKKKGAEERKHDARSFIKYENETLRKKFMEVTGECKKMYESILRRKERPLRNSLLQLKQHYERLQRESSSTSMTLDDLKTWRILKWKMTFVLHRHESIKAVLDTLCDVIDDSKDDGVEFQKLNHALTALCGGSERVGLRIYELGSGDIGSTEDVATLFWEFLLESNEALVEIEEFKVFKRRLVKILILYVNELKTRLPFLNGIYRDLKGEKLHPVVAKELKKNQGVDANLTNVLDKSELGSGSFGKVYAVRDENEDEESRHKYKAVKCCEMKDDKKSIIWEKFTMTEIQKHPHKNILKLHKVWSHCGRLYLATECCRGPLADYISLDVFRQNTVIKFVFRGIADGVRHLHTLDIWHNDLKLDNILITFHDIPKVRISDFNLSRKLKPLMSKNSLRETQQTMGCKTYRAPESKKNSKAKNTAKFRGGYDYWAMGIILGELVVQKVIRSFKTDMWEDDLEPLYENKAVIEELKKVVSSRKDGSLLKLLNGLLEYNPTTRITAKTVCKELWEYANEDDVFDVKCFRDNGCVLL